MLARSLLGDEVDVFDYEHRGLEHARHGARGLDEPERRPSHEQDRSIGHLPGDVLRSQGLPGSGGPVEKQSTLCVLTGGAQTIDVARKLDRVTLDPLQYPGRQDDVRPLDLREGVDADLDRLVARLLYQRDDAAAIDVSFANAASQFGEKPLRLLALWSHCFNANLTAVQTRVTAADEDGEPLVSVLDQRQPGPHARHGLVLTETDVGVLDRARSRRTIAHQSGATLS